MRTSDQLPHNTSQPEGNLNKRKKIKLPPDTRLNKRIIEELDNLLDFVPPEQLSKSIRDIFLCYLYHEKDSLPPDFKDTVTNLQFLFGFLDEAGRREVRSTEY